MRKLSAVVIGLIFLATGAAQAQERRVPLAIEQGIRRFTLQVEVARTPRQRETGLMHRARLPEDAGMLFVYPEEQTLSFWMKNTRIPLSIAFISAKGVITEILDMDPPAPGRPPRTYTSRGMNRYALEVNRGWFERKGIGPGARVRVEGLGRPE